MNRTTSTRVAVVGGARTPFVKAGTAFKRHSALDLAIHSVAGLLERQDVDPASIDELVYGIVTVDPRVPHLAREVVLRGRVPPTMRALTVTDNCISGTSAIRLILDSIVAGRAEIGIAGGVESLSNPALLFGQRASRIFMDAASASVAKLGVDDDAYHDGRVEHDPSNASEINRLVLLPETVNEPQTGGEEVRRPRDK